MGRPLTDYEKYIRTDELLALQKAADRLTCHDEMQFQLVHQVAELWMKLIDHEFAELGRTLPAGDGPRSLRLLGRVRRAMGLLVAQMEMLDTMSPRDYMTIRNALGRGSGQESPGFKRMLAVPGEVWPAFTAFLSAKSVTLRQLYEHPDAHEAEFQVAEALVDFDQALQQWRMRHLLLVYRQIGAGTPSLKGKPTELLERSMRQPFYPELWELRETMFSDFVKGASLKHGDAY